MNELDRAIEIQSAMRNDVSDARRANESLEARVRELEQQVNHLQESVRRLEARLHG